MLRINFVRVFSSSRVRELNAESVQHSNWQRPLLAFSDRAITTAQRSIGNTFYKELSVSMKVLCASCITPISSLYCVAIAWKALLSSAAFDAA